ncbi:hypothetical protein [Pseudomonas sp. CFBP 13719]|uniref:hypothetical protein n=1 Tax=Pseudomonas sp. CFBP 13719 TaxID=2775303 RepID=UPI00177E14F5|nr:hypothetical protein [Pseudomonas sp. CFBP 13719]MBD8681931.1 hypothetical protein [Pseudomonas sp. CFBP 13719]
MTTYPGLPSYVRANSDVSLDSTKAAERNLIEGKVQHEALAFFMWVAEHHGDDNLEDTFEMLRDADPDAGKGYRKLPERGSFLSATVALALLVDLGPIAAHLNDGKVSRQRINGFIRLWARHTQVDLVKMLPRKGPNQLCQFCDLYNVSQEDLALKVASDDDLAAYQVFAQEGPYLMEDALSHIAYDPLSAIRAQHDEGAMVISHDEMRLRFRNQITAFHEHSGQINPNKPTRLQPSSYIHFEEIQSLDHKLRVFPGYLPLLREETLDMASRFGFYATLDLTFDAEQLNLLKQLLDDFKASGAPMADVIVPIMSYQGFGKANYLNETPEHRHALYRSLLVELAAAVGDDPYSQSHHNKLFILNHLILQEPRDALEKVCDSPSKWHAMYRATQDSKYLNHLSTRIDAVFSQDLGL